MHQRMYAYIRKTVRIFDSEFLFSKCRCKDNTKTHIVIHILIGMFNSNPMIPTINNWSNIHKDIHNYVSPPSTFYRPAETGTRHAQWPVEFY